MSKKFSSSQNDVWFEIKIQKNRNLSPYSFFLTSLGIKKIWEKKIYNYVLEEFMEKIQSFS